MNLIILKSDVDTREKYNTLELAFSRYPKIKNWNVDSQDIDRVLRIEADEPVEENEIIQFCRNNGINCECLPD